MNDNLNEQNANVSIKGEKAQKTPSQLKRKYATLQYTFFASEFLSVLAPFVAIAITNKDKYFVEYDGTKMTIACFMALALMGIAIWSIAKKKLEGSYTSLIIGWVVIAFIFQMMGDMITDLATIMWVGLIGILGAFGLDVASNKMKKKKDLIIQAKEQADKENMVDAVKVEQATKKVKVKVKK